MTIQELFLYDKIRSNYVHIKRRDGLTYRDVDILMYCRFFADADGWVNYTALREYVRYSIKLWKTITFRNIILSLQTIDLIELRDRKGSRSNNFRKSKSVKDITYEKQRAGGNIQLRLTAKGMRYVYDFDKSADIYLHRYLTKQMLRASGLKDDDEEFKTLDDYEQD